VVRTPQGKLTLQNMVNRVRKELKENEIIFNKNLEMLN
jgi:hypothetical protein